jgi:putative colanic acid biosynthesis glycosyltransferase
MKKLLQIGIEVNSGSTGRIAEGIGEVALDNGWDSYITYARGYRPSKSKTIKIGNNLNIYSHVLQTRFLGNHCSASTLATKNLIKKIKTIKPDIIHLHQLHGYYLNIEVLLTYLVCENVLVVWTLHDCWAFTGHCAYFSMIDCHKWEKECNNCPQIHKYPKSYVDRSSINFQLKRKLYQSQKNLTVVTVSNWLHDLAGKSMLKDQRILTIQNGVDINRFYPCKDVEQTKEKYRISDKPVVMGVGTIWTQSKGYYDYFKLRECLPSSIQIVLVGLTQKQIKQLPAGIIGIPRTESISELARLYSIADVVTCLSYQESFGLTPIEGFACGTPAIVYNTTALPELISPETGLIVEPGAINSLVGSIKMVISNGKSHYTQNCLKRSREDFDIRKKYIEYIKLYDKLLVRDGNNG